MSPRGALSLEHVQVPGRVLLFLVAAVSRGQRCKSGLGVDRACRLALGTLTGPALPTGGRGPTPAPPGLQLPARLGPGDEQRLQGPWHPVCCFQLLTFPDSWKSSSRAGPARRPISSCSPCSQAGPGARDEAATKGLKASVIT